MKHIHYIYTLLFGVAVLLFFGLAYPHHLHYQEQFQLFLFDSTYAWDIIKLPGGISDLLGRFSTQFFLYAWVGALIIAVLLSLIQLLTLHQFNAPLGRRTLATKGTQECSTLRSAAGRLLPEGSKNDQWSMVNGQWSMVNGLTA